MTGLPIPAGALKFTPHELEILDYMVAGLSYDEIARLLRISRTTVHHRMHMAAQKIGGPAGWSERHICLCYRAKQLGALELIAGLRDSFVGLPIPDLNLPPEHPMHRLHDFFFPVRNPR